MKVLLISTVFLYVSVNAIINPGGGGGGGGGGNGNGGKTVCPVGYKLFKRDYDRSWCMKYFSGNETFFEAEKICRCQGGASLSGIENFNELSWVIEQAEESFEENNVKSGGIWVGAYRRKPCRVENMENVAECTKETQYQWTDRHTIGKTMWEHRWAEGAPHNNKFELVIILIPILHENFLRDHQEFCVQLQVSIDPPVVSKNFTNGYFDNRVCVDPKGTTPFPTEGFVCGRPGKTGGGKDGYSGGGGNGEIILIGGAKPTKKA
uniref:C-type lectin domain-containing protein n=1 Tax=Caenorhabditis tropicalis TaxID=1561998 RepID=A0A1I7T091_9PELO